MRLEYKARSLFHLLYTIHTIGPQNIDTIHVRVYTEYTPQSLNKTQLALQISITITTQPHLQQ